MKKFMVLYQSTVPASQQMAQASPEQMKAGMDLWMTWSRKAGTAIVDLGMPLGNGMKVTGGSTGSSDSKVSGFSILQAESTKAVGDLMKGHPHFMAPGASIEVLEFMPMPGMPQK
jgi:hypothetical protein